ncbi:MAG TPA: hypothetical protein P5544_07940 [Candidatus Nanopelagicales bacterium]|nr:hypothetical protein [Candidatus Nanopelagicales bacterium]
MSWLWVILGALLIALVVSVLFGFFYWRPRAQKRVTRATELLAQELHGRPPLLIGPAQCRKAEFRDAGSLPGLGVLALTEQAVLYASDQRVVIMSREDLQVSGKGRNLEFESHVPPGRLVVTLPDPSVWRSALAA